MAAHCSKAGPLRKGMPRKGKRSGMRWTNSPRVTVFGAIALALAGAWCPSEAQAQPKQLPTIRFVIPNVEQTIAAATAVPARPTPAAPTSEYWWNQPDYVEAFSLSVEQRKRMDAAMAETQRKTDEAIRKQNEARDRFHDAVKKRDWAAARQATEDWERAFASQWGVGNQAKIAVLEQLTPSQHEKLLREYPYLLDRPWTLGRRIQVQRGTPGTVAGNPTPPTGKSTSE